MNREELVARIKNEIDPNHKGKYYALMLFETELERGISSNPNKWVNTGNAVFTNGTQALNAYANTPNPASQLIDATSPEELATEMLKMADNFQNEKWLNESLYPYL